MAASEHELEPDLVSLQHCRHFIMLGYHTVAAAKCVFIQPDLVENVYSV